MVMERVQEEDTGEPNMQCSNHTHKNTSPGGGICAFCLQEKLGKLVSSASSSTSSSSSFPIPVFPSSSSSPSPNTFRSDFNARKSNLSSSSIGTGNITHHLNSTANCQHHQYHSSRAFRRIPFVLTQKRKKNKDQADVVFNRSKSTTTPRLAGNIAMADEYTPRKRGLFASLMYLSKSSSTRKIDNRHCKDEIDVSSNGSVSMKKREEFEAVVEENESPETEAFDRKVSRSRSVGCGSRSFSGDFFERISTGFGDCTLRRVESHREGKSKITPNRRRRDAVVVGGGREHVKDRVKCRGIFSGFMATSSSSSSSSSSCLVSSSAEDSRASAATTVPVVRHGRSKTWGWAFASPLRAFHRPSSSGKKEGFSNNTTPSPNLNAIPSLLVLRG